MAHQTPASAPAPVAAAADLTGDLADIIRGYERLGQDAPKRLDPVISRLHDMHQAHADTLFELIEDAGGRPENDGAAMGAVKAAVDTADDWFARAPAEIPTILDGEERLLERYSETARATDADHRLHDAITAQRDSLHRYLAALREC